MRIPLDPPTAENHKHNHLFADTATVEVRSGDQATAVAPEYDRSKLADGDGGETSYRKSLEPHGSMEFESKEDAFNFYKEYASSVGFSAIIKASRRSRISGKFIDAKFVCTRYGSKRGTSLYENSQPADDTASRDPVKKKRGRINRSASKTDCKACLHVKRRQDGRWTISSFLSEHNHELVLDQAGRTSLDICHHNAYALNAVQAKKKKTFISMSPQSGRVQKAEGHATAGSSFYGSRLGFREGDAQVMFEYFSCMQEENPYFFYAMDLDREQHLKNVFWVDAKGRIDYQIFGDVVLFDTMYKKNEFKLPFVPFIGVNNHFQFLLLGSALVADESKSTYVWLMRAWIRSMRGQVPKVILTDQDPALREAIAEVLPGSRHCFCLWHILSKIQEKLGCVIRQHENFMDKFYKCILKAQTEAQFEKRWWKLVDRFDLRTDQWVQSLYDERLRWVPMFMKDIFLAGLSSTQRLDSITSLLDKCLSRKTSLKEFLHQYTIMLQDKYEDEAKADFDTWHRQPGLKSPSPYGKQMAKIYTHAVFKKFQVEVLGVVACHPKLEGKDGPTTTFKVQDFEQNQVHKVIWNEKTADTSCTCRLFEYNGFLCRHVMIILQISGVNNIPGKYILKRWTKDAKKREAVKQIDATVSRNQRYNDLCQRACKLGNEGSLCQETYSIVFTALEAALIKCESINSSVQNVTGPSSPSNDRLHEFEVTRGKFSGKTIKEGIISGKEKGYLNFRPSAVDCSYVSQESVRWMFVSWNQNVMINIGTTKFESSNYWWHFWQPGYCSSGPTE
ncbi:protein FAR-RED IMPAIRED RESPONSE 1 isoform X2 [Sesamum indicum]|uniref:Protein FAR1-RELATED SEQUENCE n=1 Tax=Sesamum indicum TaxID=4182 RepID=A0A6I9UFQ3_SESIN|nr:protein FAR-RED IMPAIRED RESPONSE 1 isoform X2 [Sesamum indicum]XP_011096827.1 protein FAR-RED IMPAIRED RESPONSE 1 isoform X2 [Sesamum indicum]